MGCVAHTHFAHLRYTPWGRLRHCQACLGPRPTLHWPAPPAWSKGIGLMPSLEIIRPLTPGDLQEEATTVKGSRTPELGRLRTSHHAIARLLAEGKKAVEISAITGYSQSRISILQGDPAFRELVAYYGQQVEGTYASVHERLAALSLDAAQELQSRLDEDGKSLSTFELMELVKLGDKVGRKGHTPEGAGGVSVQISFVDSAPRTITQEGEDVG